MAQRVLKVLVPLAEKERALGLLDRQQDLRFWQEETSTESFVVSVLVEVERSEVVMDLFAAAFTGIDGFQLIVFPVAASLPRPVKAESDNNEEDEEGGEEAGDAGDKKRARVSREELYAAVVDSSRLSATFLVMAGLAAVVAAAGLLKDETAVIIGAMVIAPFLGPNVALALSSSLADRELGSSAIKTLLSGVGLVLLFALVLGCCWQWFNPQQSLLDIGEIASRTRPTLSDPVLAFASGCAGVWAICSGTASSLIGVMVAVALLPPLTVAGLLLGCGEIQAAMQALLLFCTNIIGINLAGVLTFYLHGVTPRMWWEEGRAKAARRRAVALWSLLMGLLLAVLLLFPGGGGPLSEEKAVSRVESERQARGGREESMNGQLFRGRFLPVVAGSPARTR